MKGGKEKKEKKKKKRKRKRREREEIGKRKKGGMNLFL